MVQIIPARSAPIKLAVPGNHYAWYKRAWRWVALKAKRILSQ